MSFSSNFYGTHVQLFYAHSAAVAFNGVVVKRSILDKREWKDEENSFDKKKVKLRGI